MKTRILIIIISIFSIFSNSQSIKVDYDSQIKTSFNSFVTNIKNKNINNAVEFIYPKFFKVVAKEQMKQILNFTYNNPALGITILEYKTTKIENPEKINNELFSIINYTSKMNFKMDWNSIPNGLNMKKAIIDGLYKKFGKENVSYNSKGDYYLINSKMKACAISSNGKDWKFLILEESYKNKLNNILPKKILDKF